MENQAAFHIGALVGHRIAIDTLIKAVLIDLYSRQQDGAAAFEAIAQKMVTDMYGITPRGVGNADAEYIKQQAIHSLETLLQGIPNAIRRERGEPDERPN